ncbi:MAG: hypothetical protein FJZ57_04970, partial [Chlamydiae bacterium]|nr:hypothetical protein [Chlamydiota bacterium]
MVDCSKFFSPGLLKNLTLPQKQEVLESLVSMILNKGGNHENYPLSCRLRKIVKVDPQLAVLFSKSPEITDVVFKSLGIRIPENYSAYLDKKTYQQALWDVVLDPQEFLNNICQYDITDHQSFFDLFYIILEDISDKSPKEVEESFCRMIEEARIVDPVILKQAAVALAVVDEAAIFLAKHNIGSYEETIAVLQSAVCFERFSVKTLQNYPLLQEEDVIDIFKMSLKVDDQISLLTIKSLNITSSKGVYSLACLILDIEPRLFVMGFNSYFCPSDQIDKMNLGVHLALNAPGDLSSVIRKLDLTLSQRKWLAKMVILSGASESVININEFNLFDKHEIECLEIARKISPKLVYEASRKTRQKCYSNPDLRRESVRLSLYRFLVLVGSGNHYNLNDIYDFFSLDKSNLIFEEQEIREEINKDNIYQVCLELYVANYGDEFFRTSDGEKVFKEISSYRNRQMASYLLHELACQLDIEEYLDVYMDLASSNGKMNIHKILPSILIAKWISEMDDPESQEEHVDKVKDCFQLLRDSFRDCNTFVMARFLSALEIIDGNIFLSFEKKIELVGRICALIDPKDKVEKKINTASFVKALNCVIALGSLKAQQKFFNLDFSEDINIDLHQLLQEILVEDLFKELPPIENCVDRFRDTFGLTRVPNALEIYMQKINRHGEIEVRYALQDFIVSVLNGTFSEVRYQTDRSIHLKTLQQIDPAVFEAWKVMPQKLSIEVSLKDATVDYREVFMFSCLHKHWHVGGVDLLPELTLFLERGIKTPG